MTVTWSSAGEWTRLSSTCCALFAWFFHMSIMLENLTSIVSFNWRISGLKLKGTFGCGAAGTCDDDIGPSNSVEEEMLHKLKVVLSIDSAVCCSKLASSWRFFCVWNFVDELRRLCWNFLITDVGSITRPGVLKPAFRSSGCMKGFSGVRASNRWKESKKKAQITPTESVPLGSSPASISCTRWTPECSRCPTSWRSARTWWSTEFLACPLAPPTRSQESSRTSDGWANLPRRLWGRCRDTESPTTSCWARARPGQRTKVPDWCWRLPSAPVPCGWCFWCLRCRRDRRSASLNPSRLHSIGWTRRWRRSRGIASCSCWVSWCGRVERCSSGRAIPSQLPSCRCRASSIRRTCCPSCRLERCNLGSASRKLARCRFRWTRRRLWIARWFRCQAWLWAAGKADRCSCQPFRLPAARSVPSWRFYPRRFDRKPAVSCWIHSRRSPPKASPENKRKHPEHPFA